MNSSIGSKQLPLWCATANSRRFAQHYRCRTLGHQSRFVRQRSRLLYPHDTAFGRARIGHIPSRALGPDDKTTSDKYEITVPGNGRFRAILLSLYQCVSYSLVHDRIPRSSQRLLFHGGCGESHSSLLLLQPCDRRVRFFSSERQLPELRCRAGHEVEVPDEGGAKSSPKRACSNP